MTALSSPWQAGAVPLTPRGGQHERKITIARLVGLTVVVAGLASGTATASNTPQGLKADGLRLQSSTADSSQSGFDWAAAFIGAASSLGFVACCLALLVGTRCVRRQRMLQT